MKSATAIDKFRRATARRLRARATDTEKRLWTHLRQAKFDGSHFRRQVPIGRYVVDFACMASRIVIEIDGSQHGTDRGVARDELRTKWLRDEGYRVLRFWNNDVHQNIGAVMDAIYAAVYGSLHAEPTLLKHTRRERRSTTIAAADHPTPARFARRPSPSRGG